jgi:ParB family transcriptional regulator, chromosome partitioning protein
MKTPSARPAPQMIPLADLEIGPRLRPVSEAGVEAILASIAETGVMKDAIHVRRRKDGRLVLIAGAHRSEVAKRLGWTEIEAIVWRDVADDWVKLIEIDDNLAGAEMTALDTAVFLSRRKAIYERLHPEAKAGGDRRSAAFQTEMISVRSFAASTAEKFGMSDRHVRNLVAAGEALTDAMVDQLRTAKQPVGTVDLIELSKIGDDDERAQVVLKVATGQARKVRQARVQWASETGRSPAAPVAAKDADYTRLAEAWTRATPAARRRFVAAFADDLAECGVGDA